MASPPSSNPSASSAGQDAKMHSQRAKRIKQSNTSTSGQGAQVFQFVDRTKSSRKEARSFVMKKFVQRKKEEQNRRLQSSLRSTTSNVSSQLQWTDRQHNVSQSESGAMIPYSPRPSSSGHGPPPFRLPYDPVRESASPSTLLSAATSDPFDTLPIRLNLEGHELVECWNQKLQYRSGLRAANYIKDVVFQHSATTPLAFQATILCYSARYKSQALGFANSPLATKHINATSTALSDYVHSEPESLEKDNNICMVLISQALQEARYGKRETAQNYMRTAMEIQRHRPKIHRVIQTYLFFVDYTTQTNPYSPTNEHVQYFMFSSFLRNLENLMFKQSTLAFRAIVPQRDAAFHPGSILHQVLSIDPYIALADVSLEKRTWDIMKGKQKHLHDLCRTACLIYINAALWDFRDSTDLTAAYLDYLQRKVEHHELDKDPAIELLVWLLLEEEQDPRLRNRDRAMFGGEMLQIAKRLNPSLQTWLNQILLAFLTLKAPIPSVTAWEESIRSDLVGKKAAIQGSVVQEIT